MSGTRITHGNRKNAYKFSVGNPETKRLLGRPKRRWEDSITIDLTDIGCDSVDWIHMGRDRDQWLAL
jgi:hypothetical protein